jgi:hypothetical protein
MSKNDVYFIDVQYIKDNSVVLSDIEEKFINFSILESTQGLLSQTIGQKLLEELKFAVRTGSTTADQELLIDNFVTNILLYNSIYECLPHINFKITPKGVTQQSSEYSSQTDLKIFNMIREEYKNKAEYWVKKTVNFLLDNQTIYDSYLNCTDTSHIRDERPDFKAYKSPIVFPNDINNGEINRMKFYKKY